MLVIEDVHWADDATLDALRYLVRRIAGLPAVLVLTYRDDELDREHALHGLLGQASRSDRVRHLPLRRLSADAVRRLSAGSTLDAAGLYALTSGNPFFVHELLAGGHGDRVPPSIADAVLARVRRLGPATQDALEQLAVVPAARLMALNQHVLDALTARADRGQGRGPRRCPPRGRGPPQPGSRSSGTFSPLGYWLPCMSTDQGQPGRPDRTPGGRGPPAGPGLHERADRQRTGGLVRTVHSHVAAVLGKLGARDRRGAAARAAELGLLDARDR